MNFQIMQQVAGKDFIPAVCLDDEPLIYSCPKKAAVVAAKLTKERGIKFQPRPVIETAIKWHNREKQRFADGKYKPVVWVGQEWWDKNHNPDHFAHVSIKDATLIAYTKGDKEGSADIQTSTKPGKYLAEFFSAVLTPGQIKEFAMQHSTIFETNELKFATTPEEIERVYQPRLGSSCFSGTTKANLYGSSDFAVAYIRDSDGNIKARALCCVERKIYVRSYGDEDRLDKLLEDSGYTKTDYDKNRWLGLRLLKAHHWCGFYTDFGGGVGPHPTEPEKFLVII